jgi:hypothetical protein
MSTLLSDIEAFQSAHGLSDWQFGELALRDRHFIRQLRDGREPRRKTIARVRHVMATYRPQEQVAA